MEWKDSIVEQRQAVLNAFNLKEGTEHMTPAEFDEFAGIRDPDRRGPIALANAQRKSLHGNRSIYYYANGHLTRRDYERMTQERAAQEQEREQGATIQEYADDVQMTCGGVDIVPTTLARRIAQRNIAAGRPVSEMKITDEESRLIASRLFCKGEQMWELVQRRDEGETLSITVPVPVSKIMLFRKMVKKLRDPSRDATSLLLSRKYTSQDTAPPGVTAAGSAAADSAAPGSAAPGSATMRLPHKVDSL